jgi:SAM-dependent methyltransferase
MREILMYASGRTTPARQLADSALKTYMPQLTGHVIEIGARGNGYASYAINAVNYVLSNLKKEHEGYIELNATKMDIKEKSVDGYVCVSVLEHIEEPAEAIAEIHRTLKVNGKLLLIVPFMYPYHADPFDYSRFTVTYLEALLKDFKIVTTDILGGSFNTVSMILQKPFRSEELSRLRKSSRPQYVLHKIATFPVVCISRTIGACFYLLSRWFQGSSDYASMICVVAEKK